MTLLDWDADPWWQARPLLLRVVEGEAPPSWDAATRELTVALPKAARVTIGLASRLAAESLADAGAYALLLERLDPFDPEPQRALLEELALTGRLWALTPSRAVTLVHAVHRPLQSPKTLVLRAARSAGWTATALLGEVRVHGASTDRLALEAAWQQWRDVAGSAPALVPHAAPALELPLHLAADARTEPAEDDRTERGRYREADDLVLLGAEPANTDAPPYLSTHELGDTRHRVIRYTPVATTRFREYFRPELVAGPEDRTRRSDAVEVDVPSAAPPPPPRLVAAVPLFGWERTATASGETRTTRRRGGGLRLYLDRPWYESGDGELLGIVLWPDAGCPVPAAVEHLVTRCGDDPLWQASAPPELPTPGALTRRVAVGEGLPLLEARATTVTVAGHAVEYDCDRDLWVCDVELDLGPAYFPFVRLALARYQPSSIARCHLSAVLSAQFAQVAPERIVTLAAEPDDPRQVSLSVLGPGHGPAAGVPPSTPVGEPGTGGPELDVWVEARVPGVDDLDLGWQRADGAVVDVDAVPAYFGGLVRWSGRVTLPASATPGRHRLVVAEYERLAADGPPWRRLAAGGHAGMTAAAFAHPSRRRLVFAETFVV